MNANSSCSGLALKLQCENRKMFRLLLILTVRGQFLIINISADFLGIFGLFIKKAVTFNEKFGWFFFKTSPHATARIHERTIIF